MLVSQVFISGKFSNKMWWLPAKFRLVANFHLKAHILVSIFVLT